GDANRTETAKLTSSRPVGSEPRSLGTSVAVEGDTIVAGAPTEGGFYGPPPGAVYTFDRTGPASRNETARLAASTPEGGALGMSVAVDGDTIVAGAPGASGAAIQTGAVFTFSR